MTFSQPRITNVYEFFRDLPVTKGLIALWLLNFLLSILTNGAINGLLIYVPGVIPNGLTGLVTYPLVIGFNILALLFGALIMWQFGGSLERSWSSRNYLLFLLAASAATALVWTLGVWLFSLIIPSLELGMAALGSPWILIASVVFAWSRLNPEQTIMIWFILPAKAKWIGWASAALMFIFLPMSIVSGVFIFLLGPFALGGIATAYAWVWYRNTWAWIPRRRKEKQPARAVRHPSSTVWGVLTRPFREWQRRRRVAKLQRTFHWDDE